MLIPLSRQKFEEVIPPLATAEQYKYCWGGPADILRRVLYSLAGLFVAIALQQVVNDYLHFFTFIGALLSGTYWLWSPIYQANRRNREFRRYGFAGFLRGEVVDKFITEELIGSEETVNKAGELMIIENRERRLNLDIGDETGFTATLQVPLQREHRSIRRGDWAELLVVSNRSDLGRITKISDAYLPDSGFWVSDYPYLRRDAFREVSRALQSRNPSSRSPERPSPERPSQPRPSPERFRSMKEYPPEDDPRDSLTRDDYGRRGGPLPNDMPSDRY